MQRGTNIAKTVGEVMAMSYGGFSWKRATGITAAKRKIAKDTGIPATKAGRRRKVQNTLWKVMTGKK